MEVDLRSTNKNMQKIIKLGVLLLLMSNVNATMMPRKNNNSNSNQGLARVNRELGLGRKQKQKRKLVSSREQIENILCRDDLTTFEKVAWEKVYKTKEDMLKQACINGSTKIVVHLVKEGANVDGKDRFGNTPLYFAVKNQDHKVLKILLQAGANVNQKDILGKTPLYRTLRTGDVNLAKLLVEADTNIDSKDNKNRNVLEYGLWINTLKYSTAKEREKTLKVVNYIKFVKKKRDRVNAWLNESRRRP